MLSPKRRREWKFAVNRAGLSKSLIRMLYHALFLGASKSTWRKRMKHCYLCPIYQREEKTCGDGVKLGCGCYMPYKSMSKKADCWGEEAGFSFGWHVPLDDMRE